MGTCPSPSPSPHFIPASAIKREASAYRHEMSQTFGATLCRHQWREEGGAFAAAVLYRAYPPHPHTTLPPHTFLRDGLKAFPPFAYRERWAWNALAQDQILAPHQCVF